METAPAASSVLGSVVIIALFLFIAAVTEPVIKRLRFPHSVFLLFTGTALGLLVNWLTDRVEGGWIAEVSGFVSEYRLSAEAIFFIFLPTLIFEAAYKIDARLLFKNLLPILLLAIPALLVSTFIVGFSLHYFAGMELLVGLLFGALISATDPVAVVAIFKELGAPKRLALLVEGESLFNDGTAIVIFGIILSLFTSVESASWADSFLSGSGQFLVVFLGGVSTGFVLAYAVSWILGHIHMNPPVEILLTTILAYLSFVVADHVFHVSGVMSTVAAGVFLGRYGRTKISPGVHEFMHHFWETMAFAANSILFLSIGLLLPQVFQAASFATYLWPLVIALIAINIARAFSTFTLIPTLHMTRFVEKISRAYQVVMWWGGGLRGAIAVALALTLAGSQLTSEDQAGIIFLTFGVVLFTLVANALSIQPIIRLLGLDRLQATEVFSRELASLHAKRVASETLQKTEHFVDTRPEVKRRVLDEYLLELEELRRRVSDLSGLNAEEKKEVLAGEALLLEKHVYFDLFALGHISDLAFQDLEYEINLELDRLKGKQELFVSRRQFEEPAWYDRLFKPLARLIPSRTTKELVLRYEKGGATIISAERVALHLKDRTEEHPDLRSSVQALEERYKGLRSAAVDEVGQIAAGFPEYVDTVVEMILRRQSLHIQRKELDSMHHLGQLPDMVFQQLLQRLEGALDALSTKPVEHIVLKPENLLRTVSFLAAMDDQELQRLSLLLTTKPFLKHETLIREGERGQEMFMIARGAVQVFRGNRDEPQILATLKAGDILGEMSLLSDEPRVASAVTTTHGSALVLRKKDFQKFLDQNPQLRRRIEQLYEERLASL